MAGALHCIALPSGGAFAVGICETFDGFGVAEYILPGNLVVQAQSAYIVPNLLRQIIAKVPKGDVAVFGFPYGDRGAIASHKVGVGPAQQTKTGIHPRPDINASSWGLATILNIQMAPYPISRGNVSATLARKIRFNLGLPDTFGGFDSIAPSAVARRSMNTSLGASSNAKAVKLNSASRLGPSLLRANFLFAITSRPLRSSATAQRVCRRSNSAGT
jgi:hypothetical protein